MYPFVKTTMWPKGEKEAKEVLLTMLYLLLCHDMPHLKVLWHRGRGNSAHRWCQVPESCQPSCRFVNTFPTFSQGWSPEWLYCQSNSLRALCFRTKLDITQSASQILCSLYGWRKVLVELDPNWLGTRGKGSSESQYLLMHIQKTQQCLSIF